MTLSAFDHTLATMRADPKVCHFNLALNSDIHKNAYWLSFPVRSLSVAYFPFSILVTCLSQLLFSLFHLQNACASPHKHPYWQFVADKQSCFY